MKILLTNDDGIEAAGLSELARILLGMGELYVVAPDRQRSAVSHAITVGEPLTLEPFDFPVPTLGAWRTSGTPADCVRLAMEVLLPQKPDLLVSGINQGLNLGLDVLYSGTVAGAMEGHLYGVPSIACSQDSGDFGLCRSYLAELIGGIAASPNAGRFVWNLNLPSCTPEEYRGVLPASLARFSQYPCRFVPGGTDIGGRRKFHPLSLFSRTQEEGSDTDGVARGYCTVTPLNEFFEDTEALRVLRELRACPQAGDHTAE